MTKAEELLLEEVVGQHGAECSGDYDEDYPEKVRELLEVVRRERLDRIDPEWRYKYEQADFLQKESKYMKLALIRELGGGHYIGETVFKETAAKSFAKLRRTYEDFDIVWQGS